MVRYVGVGDNIEPGRISNGYQNHFPKRGTPLDYHI